MVRVTLAQTNFNAGELSPLALGRIDIDKYASGCEILENFIPTVQGPITRRSGTKYISRTVNNAKSLLIPFKSSVSKVFLLEFYDKGIRVFYNDQVVAQIVAPWSASELFTARGECALSYVQSADVLYICSKNYPPQKLAAYSSTKWELKPLSVINGPYKDIDYDNTVTVTYSTSRGPFWNNHNLTASSNIFAEYKANSDFEPASKPFYFGESFNDSADYWLANHDYTFSQENPSIVRNDSKNYMLRKGGKSGYVAPTHTRGTRKDGNPGCSWEYRNASYDSHNWNYAADNQISISGGSFNSSLPMITWSSSTCFALFAWLRSDGYPTHVCFFRNRLCFARGQTLWFSRTSDYENFASTEFGEITDDCAITVDIQNGDTNQISFLYPTPQGLIVGTSAGLTMVSEAAITEPFSPTNILATQLSGVGAAYIPPIRLSTSNIFVQRTGKILRDAQLDADNNILQAININLLNDTITNDGIIQTVLVEIPQSIVWCLTAKGTLIGLTFEKDQQVYGWHRHTLGSNATIESIAVLPALDGSYDQLYLSVARRTGSEIVRTIEVLQQSFYGTSSINAWMVDCGYRITSATPISEVSNLIFANGTELEIVLDGAPAGTALVNNGKVTLPYSATNVLVGIGYSSKVKIVPPMGGSQTGASMGKKKRISMVILKLLNSAGGSLGQDFSSLSPLDMRKTSDRLDQAIPLFTGEYEARISSDYELDQSLCILQEQPLPFTLVAVVMELELFDR